MAYRTFKRSREPSENEQLLDYNSQGRPSGMVPDCDYHTANSARCDRNPAGIGDSVAHSVSSTLDQYGLLPAGTHQPFYPILPGSWLPDGTFQLSQEVIRCSECVLYPPPVTAVSAACRERPVGCRTLIVTGLPNNTTAEILRDIFARCGEIRGLRHKTATNFAYIVFTQEAYVSYGLLLSGYRVRLSGDRDCANVGRLHCSYGQNPREDTNEYSCQQQLVALHGDIPARGREMADNAKTSSPPPAPLYSTREVQRMMEAIKDETRFTEAAHIVAHWMQRGDCVKRTVNYFYSIVQSTNKHVTRLTNEMSQLEQQLRAAREHSRSRQQQLLVQFGCVERVYVAVSRQKVWDHLSKGQRRYIEVWKRQAANLKKMFDTDVSADGGDDDEMDISDGERCSHHTPATTGRRVVAGAHQPPQGNGAASGECESTDPLCQHCDKQLADSRQRLAIVTETMHNVQQQLLLSMSNERALEKQLASLKKSNMNKSAAGSEKARLEEESATSATDGDAPTVIQEIDGNRAASAGDRQTDDTTKTCRTIYPNDGIGKEADIADSQQSKSVTVIDIDDEPESTDTKLSGGDDGAETEEKCVSEHRPATDTLYKVAASPEMDKDARIIGLVSPFLVVHPMGTRSSRLCAYLQQFVGLDSLQPAILDATLHRYPSLFAAGQCEDSDICDLSRSGAGLESDSVWTFAGYRAVRH